jgi:hypothetical protein
MFCERCGRLLNRATGRCVCEDNPSLAVPPAAPTTATGTTTAVLDPAPPEAAAPRPVTNGQQSRPTPVKPEQQAPEPRSIGPIRGKVSGLRSGVRRYELFVHDDALAITRVSGVDPVFVGRVIGALAGPLGLILGDAAGRALSRRSRPEATVDPIPLDQVVAVTVQRLPWGGRVRIGAGGAGGKSLRWSRRDVNGNELAGLLHSAVGRRFSLLPYGNGLRLGYRAAVALLLLGAFATVAMPIKMLVFPTPPPGHDLPVAAREGLSRACPAWRASPLEGPQLTATAKAIRPDITKAAASSSELKALAPALDTVESFAPKVGANDAPLAEAAKFGQAVDVIDAACTRIGA